MFILAHPVNFPVGGNRSARRKPTTFGRVLTDSFHMSRALGSSNIEKVLAENRTRNLRGERRVLWPLRHRSPLHWPRYPLPTVHWPINLWFALLLSSTILNTTNTRHAFSHQIYCMYTVCTDRYWSSYWYHTHEPAWLMTNKTSGSESSREEKAFFYLLRCGYALIHIKQSQ